MNISALFSAKTKSAMVDLLEYLRANPHRIDVLIVIVQGEFGTPEDFANVISGPEADFIDALIASVKADTESPAFMRTVMKALMSKGF